MRGSARQFCIDLAFVFAISVACYAPVLILGVPTGTSDLQHHISIANAYYDSFGRGHLISDWIFYENNGYGAVTTRFYPPLAHITLAFFQILVSEWQIAIFAAFALWSFVGSLGVYLWVNDLFGSRRASLAAAAIFAIAPYHVNQFYHSFMWAKFVALSVMPFCFLFLRRLMREPGIAGALAFGTSLAFLILSNIPQTLVAVISLGVYGLSLVKRETTVRSTVLAIGAGILSLCLTSFFWVRLTFEIDWLKIAQPNTDPWYDFRNNFLLMTFGYDDHYLWFANLILMLSLTILVAVLFASGSVRTFLASRDQIAVLIVFLLSIMLMTMVSRPIWEYIPALQRIQFPWRFLSVMSVCFSVLFGYFAAFISRESWHSRRPAVLIVLGSALILVTFTIKQDILAAQFVGSRTFDSSVAIWKGSIGLDHWHPVWVRTSTFSSTEKVSGMQGREYSIQQWDEDGRKIAIGPGEHSTARMGILYYPHWSVSINGTPVPTSEVNGALAFDVPSSAANIGLEFVEPAYSLNSRKLSLAAWILLLFAVAFVGFKKNRKEMPA